MFMTQRCGDTLLFRTPPVIAAQAAVGGKKEGEGPLAAAFDELSSDNRFGQSSWEAAEKYLQLRAARLCLQKAQLPEEKVRLVLAGDLQAQCTASGYAMRELGVPFAGVFGACSTMAETLGLGAALCASGAAEHLLAMASSHFCAAERQFRTPLSYGAVRTPHRPVDRNGGRLLPAAACRAGSADSGGHLRPCAGLSGQGHQQHGRGHGPCGRSHPSALSEGHRQRSGGL